MAVPEVGASNVANIEIVVVFPAPFGPKRPNISPSLISKSKSSTAVNLPNFLVSPAVVMAPI